MQNYPAWCKKLTSSPKLVLCLPNDGHSGNVALHYINYTLPFLCGWVLWFHFGHLCVNLSYHISGFCSQSNLVNINGFPPDLICALIDIVQIWFGIAKGQISSFWQISVCNMIVAGYYHFSFLLSSHFLKKKQEYCDTPTPPTLSVHSSVMSHHCS